MTADRHDQQAQPAEVAAMLRKMLAEADAGRLDMTRRSADKLAGAAEALEALSDDEQA